MEKIEPKKNSELIPDTGTALGLIRSHQDALDQKVKADLQRAEKNYSQGKKQAYGIASQYAPQLQKCRFKLIVYWKVKKCGTPYTQLEIDTYKNLKKIPSIDFDTYGRLNHQDAVNALEDKVYEEAHKMFKAILVWNDWFNSEEHWVVSYNTQNLIRSERRELFFKPADPNGNILFDGYAGKAIRLDKMRFYEGK